MKILILLYFAAAYGTEKETEEMDLCNLFSQRCEITTEGRGNKDENRIVKLMPNFRLVRQQVSRAARQPIVIQWVITISFVCFAATLQFLYMEWRDQTNMFDNDNGIKYSDGRALQLGHYWILFTRAFVHSDYDHLQGNTWCLLKNLIFSFFVMDKPNGLLMILFYFLSAAMGKLLPVAFDEKYWDINCVGASGANSGWKGVLLVSSFVQFMVQLAYFVQKDTPQKTFLQLVLIWVVRVFPSIYFIVATLWDMIMWDMARINAPTTTNHLCHVIAFFAGIALSFAFGLNTITNYTLPTFVTKTLRNATAVTLYILCFLSVIQIVLH